MESGANDVEQAADTDIILSEQQAGGLGTYCAHLTPGCLRAAKGGLLETIHKDGDGKKG